MRVDLRPVLCCAFFAAFAGSFMRCSVKDVVHYVQGVSSCLGERRVARTAYSLLEEVANRHTSCHRLVAGSVLRYLQCDQAPATLFKTCCKDLGRLEANWKRAEAQSKVSAPIRSPLLKAWQTSCQQTPQEVAKLCLNL